MWRREGRLQNIQLQLRARCIAVCVGKKDHSCVLLRAIVGCWLLVNFAPAPWRSCRKLCSKRQLPCNLALLLYNPHAATGCFGAVSAATSTCMAMLVLVLFFLLWPGVGDRCLGHLTHTP